MSRVWESNPAILKGDEIIIVGTRNKTIETYAYNHIDDKWLVLADFSEPTDSPRLAIYNDIDIPKSTAKNSIPPLDNIFFIT